MDTFFYRKEDNKIEKIEKKEFIKFYNDRYYLDLEADNNAIKGATGKKVSQCSKSIEDRIDSLLENGITEEKHVIQILAWKMGKIKHKDSEKKKDFAYAKDWENSECFDIQRFGKSFDIKPLTQHIVNDIKILEKQAETDPQKVLQDLLNHPVAGIGTVYLITLLYFISKGKYPIYDRFAKMALYAIKHDIKPGEIVEYKDLPEKTSSSFSNIMAKEMWEYIDEIEKIFGTEYQDSRDIDRALWVYGHLFTPSSDSSNKSTC